MPLFVDWLKWTTKKIPYGDAHVRQSTGSLTGSAVIFEASQATVTISEESLV